MSALSGFSAVLIFTNILSQREKTTCIDVLINNNIQGYDYESENYTSFDKVFLKYPDRPRYSGKYNNEDLVMSCADGKDYVLMSIDNGSADSAIILKLADEVCSAITDHLFSYIDNQGDSPKKIDSYIEKTEIKWLFKYNYFGKQFLEKYGKQFFIEMPCVKHEFITNDVIRIDLTTNIFNPIDANLIEKLNDYLNKYSIKVRFYDFRQHIID